MDLASPAVSGTSVYANGLITLTCVPYGALGQKTNRITHTHSGSSIENTDFTKRARAYFGWRRHIIINCVFVLFRCFFFVSFRLCIFILFMLLFNFVKLCIFIVTFMYSYCYVCSVLYILLSSCQLALFGYPDWGFSRKDGARPALYHISCYLCCSFVICDQWDQC